MDFHTNGANEWLGFRLELIGAIVLCVSALCMVMLPTNFIKPGIRSTNLPVELSPSSSFVEFVQGLTSFLLFHRACWLVSFLWPLPQLCAVLCGMDELLCGE